MIFVIYLYYYLKGFQVVKPWILSFGYPKISTYKKKKKKISQNIPSLLTYMFLNKGDKFIK